MLRRRDPAPAFGSIGVEAHATSCVASGQLAGWVRVPVRRECSVDQSDQLITWFAKYITLGAIFRTPCSVKENHTMISGVAQIPAAG